MTGKHARKTARRTGTVLVSTMALSAVGGTAFAWWSTTGTGTGSARAGVAQPLEVLAATVPATALLYPDGPAGSLVVKVRNPNPFGVSITAAVAGAGSVTATGGIGACTTTGVVMVPAHGLPVSVGAGEVREFTLTDSVRMSSASQHGCQGATFSVPVALTATSR